jgi:hypothetical protein
MRAGFVTGLLVTVVVAAAVVVATVALTGDGDDEPRAQPAATPTVSAPSTRSAERSSGPVARDYEMFSTAGDRAVGRVAEAARRDLSTGAGREQALQNVREQVAEVAEEHPEVYDTAVLEALADELDRLLTAAGHEPIDALDEIGP